MPLTCLYSKTMPMRVVRHEEVEALVATGAWFKHPNDVKQTDVTNKDITHEKPIRQRTRKRRSNAECETKTL